MPLQIAKKTLEPDIVVLELKGRISIGRDSQELEYRVMELLGQDTKKLVFDMDGVQYIDSTGVGIIAFCCGKLKQSGGELRLGGVKGIVQEVFNITGLSKVVSLYPSATEAARSFNTPG